MEIDSIIDQVRASSQKTQVILVALLLRITVIVELTKCSLSAAETMS
jgi:hypothetical protein